MSDDVKIGICIVTAILGVFGIVGGAWYAISSGKDDAKVQCVKAGQTAEACEVLFNGRQR